MENNHLALLKMNGIFSHSLYFKSQPILFSSVMRLYYRCIAAGRISGSQEPLQWCCALLPSTQNIELMLPDAAMATPRYLKTPLVTHKMLV